MATTSPLCQWRAALASLRSPLLRSPEDQIPIWGRGTPALMSCLLCPRAAEPFGHRGRACRGRAAWLAPALAPGRDFGTAGAGGRGPFPYNLERCRHRDPPAAVWHRGLVPNRMLAVCRCWSSLYVALAIYSSLLGDQPLFILVIWPRPRRAPMSQELGEAARPHSQCPTAEVLPAPHLLPQCLPAPRDGGQIPGMGADP